MTVRTAFAGVMLTIGSFFNACSTNSLIEVARRPAPALCELALQLRDVGPRCLELAVKLRDARTIGVRSCSTATPM
jgi:hypothetical protein